MSHVDKQLGVVVKSFKEIDGCVVYPVTHNLVDLFWGEGFTNQARFKWQKSRGGERRNSVAEPVKAGEWVLWSKSSSLPKGFTSILEAYRKN